MAYFATPQPIPAVVQYWFNYCAQWNNAPGGNVLHLYQNNMAIPVNPPLVGVPPVQPAPFNGPFLINNPDHGQRPVNQQHPTGKGAGVFLGFCPVQDPDLPDGNNSANPMRWCVAYGRCIHPRKGKGQSRRPKSRLCVWRRPRTYTGQINDLGGRTRIIKLEHISTIQSLRGLNKDQILAYVRNSEIRDRGNQPGEYNAQLAHLRALQWAHVNQFIGPHHQQLRREYGI